MVNQSIGHIERAYRHRQVEKFLAQGKTVAQVGALTGLTVNQVRDTMRDGGMVAARRGPAAPCESEVKMLLELLERGLLRPAIAAEMGMTSDQVMVLARRSGISMRRERQRFENRRRAAAILPLVREGWSIDDIASRSGLSPKQVRDCMSATGILARFAQVREIERARIVVARADGMTINQIAEHTGRSRTTVKDALKDAGLTNLAGFEEMALLPVVAAARKLLAEGEARAEQEERAEEIRTA